MNIQLLISLLGIILDSNPVHSDILFTIYIPALDTIQWLGILELPVLLTTLICSTLVISQFKTIRLGPNLILLFWGIVIMGLGQFRMQTAHLFHDTVLNTLFGYTTREYLWYITLIVTWVLPIAGFYKLYSSSRL